MFNIYDSNAEVVALCERSTLIFKTCVFPHKFVKSCEGGTCYQCFISRVFHVDYEFI